MNDKSKIKVLLTDGKEPFYDECTAELQAIGAEVLRCAKDGNAVIAQLEQNDFDAVIMDVFMPGADGLEVLDYINSILVQKPLAILIAAVSNAEFEQQLMAAGANYYFIKPVNAKAVAKRLEKLISWKEERSRHSLPVREDDIEVIISDMMRQIGVPAHIKGYRYLRTSIRLCIENPEMLSAVTKQLYPTVAKEYKTTASRVERAIRHAIEVAWDRGDVDVLSSYFGYTVNAQRGKPTNSEFIAMLSDKIKLALKSA